MSKRHTTHFDDCGCLTEKFTNAVGEIVKLEAKLEESEALVRRLVEALRVSIEAFGRHMNGADFNPSSSRYG